MAHTPGAVPEVAHRRCDVVAVVQGVGNASIARGRGARGIVEGGQTLNPSTEQLLEAIEECRADEVVLLPNNDNIAMAARSAAEIAQRPVVVVETSSIPAGLVALDAYSAGLSAEENAAAMRAAVARVATGAVTRASRDARVEGVPVTKGAWMGLVDNRIVATSDNLGDVAARVVSTMVTPERQALMVLRGDTDAEPADIEGALAAVRAAYPAVEVRELNGGQAHYPLLFAAHTAARRLAAATTAIVFDSTADIPPDTITHPSWRMVPLTVRFGEEEYRDNLDLSGAEFYEKLRTSRELPRTSAPSPGAFEACYAELMERYRDVVSLHISSKLSATLESARAGATPFGDRVHVHDTMSASGLIALIVDAVQRMLDEGTTAAAVDAFVHAVPARSGISFSVDTLELLQRNGRIGRGAALVGGLLQVRPILSVINGEVDAVRRVRGRRAAIPALVENMLRRSAGFPEIDVAILHAHSVGEAHKLEQAVREARGGIVSLRTVQIGAVIGAHAGPGALGVAFLAR
ncbi:MAG: DegV family protein, partial [Thermoleophilia bacterium]